MLASRCVGLLFALISTLKIVAGARVHLWWETRRGRELGPRLKRLMLAAVKSAVICGSSEEDRVVRRGSSRNNYAEVRIFSNSLPSDFFCTNGGALRQQEEAKVFPFTCTATVEKYNVSELASDLDPQVATSICELMKQNHLSDFAENDRSDVMRFLLLSRYGGTYVDIAQIFLQPLPTVQTIVVSESYWSAAACGGQGGKRRHAYCRIIGSDSIPLTCIDYDADPDVVFSVYSGVLGNFPAMSHLILKMLVEVARLSSVSPQERCPLSWGCFGPILVTRAVSQICKAREGHYPPVHVLSGRRYLFQSVGRSNWHQVGYKAKAWQRKMLAIVDVDFHENKAARSMITGLIDRILWWEPTDSRKLASINEAEYQAWLSHANETDGEKMAYIEAHTSVDRQPWNKARPSRDKRKLTGVVSVESPRQSKLSDLVLGDKVPPMASCRKNLAVSSFYEHSRNAWDSQSNRPGKGWNAERRWEPWVVRKRSVWKYDNSEVIFISAGIGEIKRFLKMYKSHAGTENAAPARFVVFQPDANLVEQLKSLYVKEIQKGSIVIVNAGIDWKTDDQATHRTIAAHQALSKFLSALVPGQTAHVHMDCEGCEFGVVMSLAGADMLSEIATFQFGTHARSEGLLSLNAGKQAQASHHHDVYCQMQRAISLTHELEWGNPWSWERWVRKGG